MDFKNDPYPNYTGMVMIKTPLGHAAIYAQQGRANRETHVAVPVELLERISRFRECGDQMTFDSDEDGPITPFTAECRLEAGHTATSNPDFARTHSNGYYTWSS